MATRSQVISTLLLTAVVQPGCVGTDGFVFKQDAPKGQVCRVVASWIPQVLHTEDPKNNGVQAPCFAASVYLFGRESPQPLIGDGTLTVLVRDPNIVDRNTNQTFVIERWEFDPKTLKDNVLTKSIVGWCYPLICPWGTWRPEIKTVQLQVCYQPKDGMPIYSDLRTVTLAGQDGQPVITRQEGAPTMTTKPVPGPTVAAH